MTHISPILTLALICAGASIACFRDSYRHWRK